MPRWNYVPEEIPDCNRVAGLIKDSKCLLEAAWNGDEEKVAEGVAKDPGEVRSILVYSNEGALHSSFHLAYCYAKSSCISVMELKKDE